MTNQTLLHTERLTLRMITPDLIRQLFQSVSKNEILNFFGHDEQGYAYLKMQHEGGLETFSISVLYFLLTDKESGRVIGECGFHTWNKKHRRAEVFYSLRNENDKRKGLMKEALYAVLKFGFETMELHRIAGLTADDNIASKSLLKHYGFKYEGTMREDYVVDGKNEDSICYSLLKHEWESYKK